MRTHGWPNFTHRVVVARRPYKRFENKTCFTNRLAKHTHRDAEKEMVEILFFRFFVVLFGECKLICATFNCLRVERCAYTRLVSALACVCVGVAVVCRGNFSLSFFVLFLFWSRLLLLWSLISISLRTSDRHSNVNFLLCLHLIESRSRCIRTTIRIQIQGCKIFNKLPIPSIAQAKLFAVNSSQSSSCLATW